MRAACEGFACTFYLETSCAAARAGLITIQCKLQYMVFLSKNDRSSTFWKEDLGSPPETRQ